MHTLGMICQASQCASQDHLQAGFVTQVYASLCWLCHASVCKPFPDSEWAVVVYHAFLAVSQVFPELNESARCVRLAVMGSILAIRARHPYGLWLQVATHM